MPAIDPRLDQIPIDLQDTKSKRVYFEELERFLFQVWDNLDAGTAIPAVLSEANRKADTLLYAVLDKVSLGDTVTIDTTGFTIDTTEQFTDSTES